jgi:hypothetical protein
MTVPGSLVAFAQLRVVELSAADVSNTRGGLSLLSSK